jgi:L-amino acid N-acyltransferase YncA
VGLWVRLKDFVSAELSALTERRQGGTAAPDAQHRVSPQSRRLPGLVSVLQGEAHIGLWLAQLAQGRPTAGYSVTPSARGRGIATAALRALTSFAWSVPGLHRIELHVEPWNVASVRTAERAGYAREGLMRSHQEIGGQRRDMLLYSIGAQGKPTFKRQIES